MRNFKLTICYDGSDFCGWQAQPGLPTIQGSLMDVVRMLTQQETEIFGAGRTDSGVHALGQVASFCTETRLAPDDLKRGFNALLPPTIRVLKCEEAAPAFHARFQSVAKTYQYRIYRGRVLSPFDRKYVAHDPFPLDVPAMVEAAGYFTGAHDFSSFAASSGDEETDKTRLLTREIFSSQFYARKGSALCGPGFLGTIHAQELAPTKLSNSDAAGVQDDDTVELIYVVQGKSFLRYMVRKIVGTLLDVGRGKLRPEEIPALFEMKDRSRSGMTMPPQGLYLASVEYPDAGAVSKR